MATLYVNTDDQSGGEYASLALAEAALPATLTEPYVIECAGATADTTTANFGGFGSSIANKLTVKGEIDSNGHWDETKYRLDSNSSYVGNITFRDSQCMVVEAIQAYNNYANNSGKNIHLESSTSGMEFVHVKGCLFLGSAAPTKSGNIQLYYLYAGDEVIIENNILLYAGGTSDPCGGIQTRGYTGEQAFNVRASNNAIYSGVQSRHAIDVQRCSGTIDIKNNIGIGSFYQAAFRTQYVAGATILSSNNLSSDSSAPGTNSLTNQLATDIFTDAANGDFTLKADSPALRRGITVADVTTDIAGRTRYSAGVQDIGAFSTTEGATFVVNTDDTESRTNWYGSLALAEAALPATLTEPYVIECAGATADATAVAIDGVTTTATNDLEVHGQGFNGDYTLQASSGRNLEIRAHNVGLFRFNIYSVGPFVEDAWGVEIGAFDNIKIIGCYILHNAESSTSNRSCIAYFPGNVSNFTSIIANNLLIRTVATDASSGLYVNGGGDNVILSNNVVYGNFGGDAITRFWDATRPTCVNNVAFNTGLGDDFQSFNALSSNNISSDATAPGANSLINQLATDIFTDHANGDFTLKSGSPALRRGVTIADITTDITGRTRYSAGVQDIGAFSTTEGATFIVNTDDTEGRSDWYASLSLAEAALPATLGEPYVIECSGSANDTSSVVFSGSSLGVHTVTVRGAEGWTYNGVEGAGYVHAAASGHSIRYYYSITLESFEVDLSTAGYRPYPNGGTLHCSGMCFHGTPGAADPIILAGDAQNVLIYDYVSSYGIRGAGIARNCVLFGCGFRDKEVTNCISISDGYQFFNCTGDYNISGGGGSSPAQGTHSLTGQLPADIFTDAANGDFTLKAGSPAIGAGADLSATFTTDITGAERTAPWDIGAFIYVASGVVIPTLLSPADAATNVSQPVTLSWSAITGAVNYQVQIATENTFASPVVDQATTELSFTESTLIAGTLYYWRVRADV